MVICGYPVRDLDRLLSFYNSAKNTGRYLVIDLKQAYLLKLFDLSPITKGKYPAQTNPHLKIYIPKGKWGLIDKDLSIFSERQLVMDYDEFSFGCTSISSILYLLLYSLNYHHLLNI